MFYLDSRELTLIEVKRNDKPQEKNKSKVYFWLLFNKSTDKIEKLDFVSMQSSKEKEERIFRQGKLNFRSTSEFFETLQRKYALENLPPTQLPEKIGKKIHTFLSVLPD